MMRSAGVVVSLLAIACGPSVRDAGDTPDAGHGSNAPDGGGGGGETTYVYAHSSSTLYRVDPDTLKEQIVGPFNWGSVGSDEMTDIAIDKTGRMVGISFSRVYKIDPSNAKTTLLSNALSGSFNGLSFVPATMLGASGDDVLVGTRNTDGKVFRIDPTTGSATEVGNMGSFTSSGDLVAVAGFGTVQTVLGTGSDKLARLAQQTFAATAIGTGTGYSEIWGVAYFKGKVYGFTNGGQFVLIDPNTGSAMIVSQTDVQWWGAAVTTVAPVLQ